jgi:hypothetical protein
MEDNLNRVNYRGESLLTFENLDEQFRDWVNWLKSVEASSRKFSFDSGSKWEDGWSWRDVGGESGEAV